MTKVFTVSIAICLLALSGNTAAYANTIIAPTTSSPSATPSERWNNENWFLYDHPEPASFTLLANGEATGTTTTGLPFFLVNVPNEANIRVQKFIIEDHYHYLVFDGFAIYSDEALQNFLIEAQQF